MAATSHIDELRKRYEENPRRYFANLASEYRKAGDLELAIAICRQHLTEAPNNLPAQVVFGRSLFDSGNLEEARTAFETVIAMDAQHLIALRHLGDIGRAQGDVPRAREWYERLLEADRRNPEVIAIIKELDEAPPTVADATGSEAVAPATEAPQAGTEEFRDVVDELASFAESQAAEPTAPPEPEHPQPQQLGARETPPRTQVLPPIPEFDPDATMSIEPLQIETAGASAGAGAPDDDARIEAELGFDDAPAGGAPAGEALLEESPLIDAFLEDAPAVEPVVESIHGDAMDADDEKDDASVAEVPEAPDSPFGLDVDLSAAAGLAASAAEDHPEERPEDHSRFGDVEIPDDTPFGARDEDALLDFVPDALEPAPAVEAVAEDLDFDLDDDLAPEPEPPGLTEALDLAVEEAGTADEGLTAAEPPASSPELRSEPVSSYEPATFEFEPDEPAMDDAQTVADDPVAHAPEMAGEAQLAQPPALDDPSEETLEEQVLTDVPSDDVQVQAALEDGVPEDIPAAASAKLNEAFATETMAELYVRQGLRQEAIAVYRRLVEARPGDLALRARLYVLESEGEEQPASSSARRYFAGLARRKATPVASRTPIASQTPVASHTPVTARTPVTPVAAMEPVPEPPEEDEGGDVATMAEEPASELEALLDETGGPASPADEAAAGTLAAAFGDAGPAAIKGNPARAGTDDVSLDRVFREPMRTPPGGPGVQRRSSSLRFDQFFTPPESQRAAERPAAPPPAPDGDDEQFRSWLSGLKKP